jgi:hypothetical protein
MVNWNNESIVTIKTQELYEKCVLEKWYNVLEILEYYETKKSEGMDVSIEKVKARLKTLYRVCYGDFPKWLSEQQVLELKNKLYQTEDFDVLEDCFMKLVDFLTEISILGSKREKIIDESIIDMSDFKEDEGEELLEDEGELNIDVK